MNLAPQEKKILPKYGVYACRVLVDGGKGGKAQSTHRPQVVEEGLPRPVGKGRVGKAGLRREGIGLQPGQQLLVVADAPVDDLGCVDVQIGKGRDDEAVPPVLHRLGGVLRGQGVVQTHNGLTLRDQIGILAHLQFPQRGGVEEGSFQDHMVLLSGLAEFRAPVLQYSPAHADH